MNTLRKILLSLIAIALLTGTATANNQTNLRQLNRKIATVKASLQRARTRRHTLDKKLKRSETEAGQLFKRITKTHKQTKQQRRQLAILTKQAKKNEAILKTQQSNLNKQLQSAYMLSRQPYAKLLLNPESTRDLQRVVTYYHFITTMQLNTIGSIQKTLNTIHLNQLQIQNQLQTLATLENTLKKQRTQITWLKKNRSTLIRRINKTIRTKNEKLAALITNKKQLTRTIKNAERISNSYRVTGNFPSLRGKLKWPARGRILRYFNTVEDQSGLKWDGDLIRAKAGTPVRAIAPGKVVFANWLSGYGLLLIISHGNGYMTIYGRNQSIFKKVGDTVKAGNLIATVGQSGGYTYPALYFAVRYNGKPMNPALWCSRRA